MIDAAITAAPYTAAEILATFFVLGCAAVAVLVTFAQINATAAKRRATGCKGFRCSGEAVRVNQTAYGLEFARAWCAEHDAWSVEL